MRKRRHLAIGTALAVATLIAPSGADAGTYKAMQCFEPSGAGFTDASFTNSSERYVRSADCGGRGLGITHSPGPRRTGSGRYGAWTITTPDGTEIVRAAARISARSQSWHVPRVVIELAGGSRDLLEGVRGNLHTVDWKGEGGRSFSGRLVCTNREECGDGRNAYIYMRRIALTLRDTVPPELGLGGTLLEDGSRRGEQVLEVSASDAGSGVRSVSVDLNGKPLANRVVECALKDGVAIRLRPCPASPSPRFEIDTGGPAFRQGPNQLRVCVSDWAPGASANTTCRSRQVRVDNACPVSDVPGAELRARFRGAGSRVTVPGDRATALTGRLTDESGAPVRGAKVCVATRVLTDGPAERVISTPTTGSDGRFRYRLPAGPSREVRVAHWAGRHEVIERYLDLQARAVPRLSISPRRTIRNGQKARFEVTIPGPAQAARRVSVQARANGRWVHVSGGQTNRRGHWVGSYRFGSTTGTRRYAFRAIVTRQAGYPYAPGTSAVRRVTVKGN